MCWLKHVKKTITYMCGGGGAITIWHNNGYQDRVKVGLRIAKITINYTCGGIGATTWRHN
jgi:hypothetical protein